MFEQSGIADGQNQFKYLQEVLGNPSAKQLFAQVASASISPNGHKPVRVRNSGNWHKPTVTSSLTSKQVKANLAASGLDPHQYSHPNFKTMTGKTPSVNKAKTLRSSIENQQAYNFK